MSAAEHAAVAGPANSTEYITHHLTHFSVGEGFWTWNIDTIFMSVLLGLVTIALF
jgi:F-type H+-transporting ATPase subunit a